MPTLSELQSRLGALKAQRDSAVALDRFEERYWQRMEKALAVLPEDEREMPAASRVVPRPPARQVIQSGYMAR